MDTLQPSTARAARRASRWLAAGLLLLGTWACAGIEPRENLAGDVDRLAERLVQSARERADLRQLRVWVAEIRETRPQTTRANVRDTAEDMIGVQLEHELVIALATRLNVVESEIVEPTLDPPSRAPLGESATARGATHVLVGDYVRQRDVLQVTVRLIDAESRLIVSAARGEVRLANVGLASSNLWAKNVESSPPPTGAALGTKVVQSSHGTAPEAAPSAPPAALSLGAPEAATASPAPVADAVAPPPAVKPSSGAPNGPVEDFESWRQRRMAEQGLGASGAVATIDKEARASTADAAARARQDALSSAPEQDAERFPWRQNPWLARLLGIPETSKSTRH